MAQPSEQPPGPPVFPPPRNPGDLGLGPVMVGITWTFTILALATTVLRLFVRVRAKNIFSDDWFMGLAMVFQICYQVAFTFAFHAGLATTPGVLVSITARISGAILLIRLFGSRWWLKWTLVVLTTIPTVLHIIMVVVIWTQVTPAEGVYNPLVPQHRHIDSQVVVYMMYLAQSTCTVGDIAYVALPVSIVWKLKLSTSRRVGLILLLGVSLFTAISSAVKTIEVRHLQYMDPNESEYKVAPLLMWSGIEQGLVVFLGGRSRKETTGGWPSSVHGASSHGYNDLERSRRRQGDRKKTSASEEGLFAMADSDRDTELSQMERQRSLVRHTGVRRTDTYTITYGADDVGPAGTFVATGKM